MNESPTSPRPLAFTGAAGKFPAWVWRALANANAMPVAIGYPS